MSETEASAERGRRRPRRWAIGVLATVAVAALLVFGRELAALVPRFAAAVESSGPWGPILFLAGYVVATLAFVPGSILTLAAGALFGLWRGTALVFVGATVGAAAAFLVARHLARGAVARRVAADPRFAAIDRAVGREGRRIVFLLRLSPVVPFNLLNYALGLTRVGFLDYVVASVGMLPATFLYVYLGKGLGGLAAIANGERPTSGTGGWILTAIGLAATVVVTAFVTRIAQRALSEVTDVA